MSEPKPLGLFADLLKWKLASRLVVFLVTIVALIPPCIAIYLGYWFLAHSEWKSANDIDTSLKALMLLGIPTWLLMPLVGPPLMGCLYVQWAMFVRRARGQ